MKDEPRAKDVEMNNYDEAKATVYRDFMTFFGIVIALLGGLMALGGPFNTNPNSNLFIGTQHPILFWTSVLFLVLFLFSAYRMVHYDRLRVKKNKSNQ